MSISVKTRWGPLAFRSVISALCAYLFWHYGLPMEAERLQGISTTFASTAGTLLGFLITAIALLTSVMDRNLIASMRRSGHYQRLVKETLHVCVLLLLILVLSIVSLFLDDHVIQAAFVVLSFLSVLALLYLVEAGIRFNNVISVLS